VRSTNPARSVTPKPRSLACSPPTSLFAGVRSAPRIASARYDHPPRTALERRAREQWSTRLQNPRPQIDPLVHSTCGQSRRVVSTRDVRDQLRHPTRAVVNWDRGAVPGPHRSLATGQSSRHCLGVETAGRCPPGRHHPTARSDRVLANRNGRPLMRRSRDVRDAMPLTPGSRLPATRDHFAGDERP